MAAADDDDLPIAKPVSPKPESHRPDEPVMGEPILGEPVADAPAKHDPILEDPFFAEPASPARPARIPAQPPIDEPVIGDVVEDEAVPVIPPVPPADKPRATPIAPRPRFAPSTPPVAPAPVAPREPAGPAPRPRVYAACSVIGCFAVLAMVAIGVVVFVAVMILGQFGKQLENSFDSRSPGEAARARPGPITATKLNEKTRTIQLPGKVDAVGRGANGRYLFLRIPSRKELVVFDPIEAKILPQRIPLAEANALFAAGVDNLLLYQPRSRMLERYDLLSWKQDGSVANPLPNARPNTLLAAAGSEGLAFLVAPTGDQAELAMLDSNTLKVALTQNMMWRGGNAARISDNGRIVTIAAPAGDPVGSFVFRDPGVGGFRLTELRNDAPVTGHIAPSPDGQYLYTARGVFNADGTRAMAADDDYFYTFPTAHENALFLSLEVGGNGRFRSPLHLHIPGSRLTVGTLDRVDLPAISADDSDRIPADQRVYLWQAAGLLAVLPADNDTLELYKVNLAETLNETAPGDFVVFGSDPPTLAVRGTRWTYTPTVWTRGNRPAAISVEFGPEGMRTSNGEIVWDVPVDATQRQIDIVIRAVDRRGKSVEQKFRLVVIDADNDS